MAYKLNRNPGVDTLHVEHPFEECNSDDAKGMEMVDDETAAALLALGDARACEICKPFAEAI
jgi:hypothetical protein